jgi:hypothetical protein
MGAQKSSSRVFEAIALVALALGIAARLFARPHAPLWIDEATSASYAAAPHFRDFLTLISWDVNAPLYYVLLRGWAGLFGLSDPALRSMSFLFSAAAPLAIAFAPVRGLTRGERLTWAALVALWIPGIGYAQSAKALALVFFLATAQTLAFAALLGRERPRLRDAALWVGLSCLAIEAHYHDVWLAVSQGLIWLTVRRGVAVRCWPAALLILPVFAEIGAKLPNIAKFTSPGVTWYALVGPRDALPTVAHLLGGPLWLVALPAVLAAFWILGRRSEPAAWEAPQRVLALTAAASGLGVVAFAAAGAFHPLFNTRYLAPFAPGVALGVVLALRWVARGEGQVAQAALALVAGAICGLWLAAGAYHLDSNFDDLEFEHASQSLMQAGVSRVVFVWDNPMIHGTHMWPLQADALAGFFYHRAERPVQVILADVGARDDPNTTLLATARAQHAGIIWLFDAGVPGTAAIAHPPHIAALDPSWICQNFTRHRVGAVACWEAAGKP